MLRSLALALLLALPMAARAEEPAAAPAPEASPAPAPAPSPSPSPAPFVAPPPPPPQPQPKPKFGENPAYGYMSRQLFAFEVKFSPYSPNIDASDGLTGKPFQELFTPQQDQHRPDSRLLTQLEFDFQFLHKHGSLGVGVTAGYARRTTHSFEYADASGTRCEVPSCTRSGDETALNVMPFSLLAVYRWDWLALRYKVPLVPYVKIGLAYYVWWIENGSGSTTTFTDPATGHKDDGYGGTFGWVLNPGISFLLDIIDQSAARTMDAELGINHSYLFIELHYADVSGLGQKGRLNLSDTTFNTGLAFEF